MGDWDAARDRAGEHNDGWRAGVQHTIHRLEQLAEADWDLGYHSPYAAAARALREELKTLENA